MVDHSWYVVNQTAQHSSIGDARRAAGTSLDQHDRTGRAGRDRLVRGHHRLDAPHATAVVFLTGFSAVIAVTLRHRSVAWLIDRNQQCHAARQAESLLNCARNSSAHGDHAVIVGVLAAGLLVLSRRLGGIAVGLILMLALGRVYVGAQNPSDTAVDLGLGAIIASQCLHSPIASVFSSIGSAGAGAPETGSCDGFAMVGRRRASLNSDSGCGSILLWNARPQVVC